MSNTDQDFHVYTDAELDAAVQSSETPSGPDDYLVLASSWAYGGGCGSESTGVWAFPHMLDALSFFLGEFEDLARSTLCRESFEEWNRRVTEEMETIRSSRSDRGADISVLGFESNRAGLSMGMSGYWNEFVPAVLDHFIEDLEDELKDRPANDGEEADEEDDEEYPDLRQQIADLKELRASADRRSPTFVSRFKEACDSYDQRHA